MRLLMSHDFGFVTAPGHTPSSQKVCRFSTAVGGRSALSLFDLS